MTKLMTALMAATALATIGACAKLPFIGDRFAPDELEAAPSTIAAAKADMMTPEDVGFDYASVMGQDDRPADDYELYEVRKVASVLAFAAPTPGMTIVDLEAGSGLYTELLSRIVGSEGSIYMQNPKEFDAFLPPEKMEARLGNDRLANVTLTKSPFDTLNVPDGSADMVTWFLGPHELWYTPKGAEAGALGNPEAAFTDIARVLKTGGHFVALDHKAAAGSPAAIGGELHRIDPAILITMAEAAGLSLVGESDVLAHPEDDLTKNVFDPEIRRKTDRFLLKFVKN